MNEKDKAWEDCVKAWEAHIKAYNEYMKAFDKFCGKKDEHNITFSELLLEGKGVTREELDELDKLYYELNKKYEIWREKSETYESLCQTQG